MKGRDIAEPVICVVLILGTLRVHLGASPFALAPHLSGLASTFASMHGCISSHQTKSSNSNGSFGLPSFPFIAKITTTALVNFTSPSCTAHGPSDTLNQTSAERMVFVQKIWKVYHQGFSLQVRRWILARDSLPARLSLLSYKTILIISSKRRGEGGLKDLMPIVQL